MRRAALLYALLTVAIAFPLSIHPASRVLSDSADTDLVAWLLSWDVHAFTHRPWAIFDANIFAPLHRTLAFSENLIGSALIAAPVIWTTGNPVLAMNLVALLACVLCGAGAYLLAQRLGTGEGGSLVCGLVFAFAPPRFLRLDQLFLATIAWMPFSLAYLQRYLDERRPRDLRIAAAFFVLQALTSGHGAVFLTLAAVIVVLWRLMRRSGWHDVAGIPRDLGWFGVMACVILLFVLLPYRSVQSDVGLRRTLQDWRPVSALSFLAAPTYVQTAILNRVAPDAHIVDRADAYLFPGWTVLALAVIALAERGTAARRRGRSRAWTSLAAAADLGAILCAALAIAVVRAGPLRIRLGDVVVLSARGASRPWIGAALCVAVRLAILKREPFLPLVSARRAVDAVTSRFAAWLRDPLGAYVVILVLTLFLAIGPPFSLWPYVYWMPGLDFVRASSRFTLLSLLSLALLAGAGVDAIVARRRRMATFATVVAGVLVVAECLVSLSGVPYHVDVPAADRWLASRPAPFTVAEVPLPPLQMVALFNKRQSTYMLHSTAHWQKTVHGWGGVIPQAHFDLYQALTGFPDADSLRRLDEFHVTYLVVHPDLYPPDEWKDVARRIDVYPRQLVLVHSDPTGRVYALRGSGVFSVR